jgi:hypothetical protein
MKKAALFSLAVLIILMSGFAAKSITMASLNNQGSIFDDFETVDTVWLYSSKIGSSAASGLERARVAIGGPLGLSASEAVYFIAITDAEGNALISECDYRVSGKAIDTRWWSLTLYDRQSQHYVPNTLNRSSWNSVSVPRDDNDAWEINISQTQKGEAWLPAQVKDGQLFELNLRIYNPSNELKADLPNIDLPSVELTSC